LAADFHLAFFILAGDASGDRVVNDRDLLQVWQELAKPIASRNLNSDLNGDGLVTQADVDLVKTHYLATLPAPAGALPITPAADSGSVMVDLSSAPAAAALAPAPAPQDPATPTSPVPGLSADTTAPAATAPVAELVALAPTTPGAAATATARGGAADLGSANTASPASVARSAFAVTSRSQSAISAGLSADLGPLSTPWTIWARFPWASDSRDSMDRADSNLSPDDLVGAKRQRMASQKATRHL